VVYDLDNKSIVEKSMHDAAGDLLQLLVYYFEVVHATIHILHYIMASALKSTSEVYPMLVGTIYYNSLVMIEYGKRLYYERRNPGLSHIWSMSP
jgi:hypothetical protein